MKLQLAIDLEDIDGAIKLIDKTKDYVDVFEYGTPLVINFGLEGLQKIRKAFPDITLLADLKIMDVAPYEVAQAYKYGADITTILAQAEDQSIKDAIKGAREAKKEILVDMIAVRDIEKRTKEVDQMGADYVCTHTGYDTQDLGETPFETFHKMKSNTTKTKTAVAGGIKIDTADQIIEENPDLLIVGGGIATVDDPAAAAKTIKDKMIAAGKVNE
ncbi:3-hexulose-6-phosphate synthase [Companilactobacillus versmoldensis]|uniref:3-hexulose-6-phosphate synthase n=1 Tax=Companilactobacillus versmoldensis DSM 14857 = KCTC 3814 TaxID=1423815 RepID=A0A0R1SL91_9LACO|nr:3-hexulose-6-phosphate synthase [Companilactobacillus versmoldensis]KRL66728.1 hexulose-6-phosphate synthase [Companilactobacillus versmoldensis DSM 14857 = KCTC 3814]